MTTFKKGKIFLIELGLYGKNISHSRSKEMYEKLLGKRINYHLLDFPDEKSLPDPKKLLQSGISGLSITYPYKKTFLPIVKYHHSFVREVQAINCLKFENEMLWATNTDYLAAEKLIKEKYLIEKKRLVVILGNGNMATVFTSIFQKLKMSFIHYYRKKDGDLNKIDYLSLSSQEDLLVINCCSRDFEFSAKLPPQTTFWDMNYEFDPHLKLQTSEVQYCNGLDLLELQALFAIEFWGLS